MNNVQTRRLYLEGVDALFARIGSSGSPEWYLTDRLGSVRDLMSNSGTILDHIDYAGFGQVTGETVPANGDRYKWTGRERDAEIDLQYNRARYYDGAPGRWLSEDPIRFDAGDSNLYRYVRNTAIQASDPTGLQLIEAPPPKRPPTTATTIPIPNRPNDAILVIMPGKPGKLDFKAVGKLIDDGLLKPAGSWPKKDGGVYIIYVPPEMAPPPPYKPPPPPPPPPPEVHAPGKASPQLLDRIERERAIREWKEKWEIWKRLYGSTQWVPQSITPSR